MAVNNTNPESNELTKFLTEKLEQANVSVDSARTMIEQAVDAVVEETDIEAAERYASIINACDQYIDIKEGEK